MKRISSLILFSVSFFWLPILLHQSHDPRIGQQEFKCLFLTADSNVMDYWPSFSPNGKTVLFSRSFDSGNTWTLFVVPSSGGTARTLSTTPLPVSGTRANWSVSNDIIAFTGLSPDGKSIVFAGQKNEGQAYDQRKNSIWLIDEKGDLQTLEPNQGRAPVWSPSGKLLVCSARYPGSRVPGIAVIDLQLP
jgi:Tol biopolymer transport system component